MKKFLALLLAALMVMALCACGSTDTAAEPEATAEPAVEAEPAAPVDDAAPAADGDLDAYKAYVTAFATAGAPNEEEGATVAALVEACASAEEIEAISQLTVLFENAGVLTYADWVAAGCPEADVSNMSAGDPSASGEGSGEATGEVAAETETAA